MGRALRRLPLRLWLGLGLAFWGGAPAGAGPAGQDSGDPFPAARLLDVQLRLAEADWRALCAQTRKPGHGYARETYGPVQDQPFAWFEAEVTLDGQAFAGARVRKKGFLGSLDERRPALKIDLNRAGQKRRYRGLRRLTLNNGKEDPTLIRQCLGFSLFRRLGLAAPRCAFARVRVNDRDLGVYVHLETIDKRFLRRWFGSAKGLLLEGCGSDFRPDWIRTFEAKRKADADAIPALDQLVEVLAGPDERLLADLAPFVDLDRFLNYWALEVLLAAHDGYVHWANNFYVFQPRGKKRLAFIPWGLDKIMPYPGRPDPRRPQAVAGAAILPQRLYRLPEMRKRYLTRMRQLLETIWDEPKLSAEARRLADLIRPHLAPDQRKGYDAQLQILLDFIAQRGRVIAQELNAGALPNPSKPLAPPAWRVIR